MDSKYKEPQMNSNERRCFHITEFNKTTHRQGRKAVQKEPLYPLWLKVFSTPEHERAPQPELAVHQRLSRAEG